MLTFKQFVEEYSIEKLRKRLHKQKKAEHKAKKKLKNRPDYRLVSNQVHDLYKGLPVQKEDCNLKSQPTPQQIAKKHGVPLRLIIQQLHQGIKVEHEHTKDDATAEKIASAHLDEDPHYYTKLTKAKL